MEFVLELRRIMTNLLPEDLKIQGRPSKYKEEYCQELIEMMSRGMLDVQIYAHWDISKDTFYSWKREHKEFLSAYSIGHAKCEAYYVLKAQERIEQGDDKGFKYYISLMNNKFGWGKDDRDSRTTNNILIQNMQVLNNKEDYLQLLEDVRDKAKELDIIDIIPEELEHVGREDSTQ